MNKLAKAVIWAALLTIVLVAASDIFDTDIPHTAMYHSFIEMQKSAAKKPLDCDKFVANKEKQIGHTKKVFRLDIIDFISTRHFDSRHCSKEIALIIGKMCSRVSFNPERQNHGFTSNAVKFCEAEVVSAIRNIPKQYELPNKNSPFVTIITKDQGVTFLPKEINRINFSKVNDQLDLWRLVVITSDFNYSMYFSSKQEMDIARHDLNKTMMFKI